MRNKERTTNDARFVFVCFFRSTQNYHWTSVQIHELGMILWINEKLICMIRLKKSLVVFVFLESFLTLKVWILVWQAQFNFSIVILFDKKIEIWQIDNDVGMFFSSNIKRKICQSTSIDKFLFWTILSIKKKIQKERRNYFQIMTFSKYYRTNCYQQRANLSWFDVRETVFSLSRFIKEEKNLTIVLPMPISEWVIDQIASIDQ